MQIKQIAQKMKTPEVSKFFGFNLKHGTIIIGIFQSILAFVFLVLSAAYTEHPHEIIDMNDGSVIPDIQMLRYLLIAISVSSAVQCISSILIIFGAETNRPNLLLPWLIINPIALLVYVLMVLIAVIHRSGEGTSIFIVSHLFICLNVCWISTYNMITVNSFYKYLKSLNF